VKPIYGLAAEAISIWIAVANWDSSRDFMQGEMGTMKMNSSTASQQSK
jgi:hypothetical protein